MTELLVHPYERNLVEAHDLFALLSTYPNLEWVSPTLHITALGAQLRASYRLQTPDALQAATAVHMNTTALLTNDPIFKRVTNFEALVLDEYL